MTQSPYRAAYGAIHHESQSGYLFTVDPPSFAEDVAKAMNAEEEARAALTPRIAGQFDTFQQWVNHASSWLTREVDSNGYPLGAMCVDAKGRRCANGRDFMRARDEDAFPVVFFWDCESAPPNGPGQ